MRRLLNSRERLLSLLNGIADGVTAQEKNGKLIYVNDVAARLSGFPSAEAMMNADLSIYTPQYDIRDPAGQPIPVDQLPGRLALQGQEPPEQVLCYRDRNTGEEKWSILKSRPVYDAQGDVEFVVNIFHDITEIKFAEEQLKRLQQVTAALSQAVTTEQVANIIIQHTMEALGGNQASVMLISGDGQNLEMVNTLGISEALRDTYRTIPLSTKAPLTDAVRDANPVWIETFQEYAARYPHIIDLVKTSVGSQATACLPLIVHGKVIGGIGISFDKPHPMQRNRLFLLALAEQCAQALERARLYEAEQQARWEAERSAEYVRRLHQVSTALGSAITVEQVGKIIVDQGILMSGAMTGSFQLLVDDGKAFASLYLARSLMGEEERTKWQRYPADPVFPATTAVRTRQAMWFGSSAEVSEQFPVMKPNADAYPGATTLLPIVIGDRAVGVINYVFAEKRVFSEDEKAFLMALTDQCAIAIERAQLYEAEQRARLRAEESDQLKLQFLAMISHELRTPLTSIKGFTSTLLADDVSWDKENQDEFLKIMDEEADKLAALIDELLDLTRLQAGKLDIYPYPQPIEAILEFARPELNILTQNHDLRFSIPPELPFVLADTKRIAQVIANLVSNAAKYAPPQTTIEIVAHHDGTTMRVDVCDDGIGIPPAMRELVFEAFQQGNGQKKGAGLGLAICKGLVEAHGGQIWIGDKAGSGTIVSFRLPLV